MSDMTEKEKRGVDLVVRAVSKKFPFIKGWVLNDVVKAETSEHTMIFIDILVNMGSYLKYFDLYPSKFYINYSNKSEFQSSSLWHWGSEEEGGQYVGSYGDSREKYEEKSDNLNEHIREMLKDRYSEIPEEYQKLYKGYGGEPTPSSLLNFQYRIAND
jgi:hypothetical protein